MINEKPALEDVVSHSGIKGMKWGVRKAANSISAPLRPNYTSNEIHSARARVGRKKTLAKSAIYSNPKSSKTKSLVRDFKNDPDRLIAQRTTRGEKAALLIFAGPSGAVVIASTAGYRAGTAVGQKIRKNDRG